MPTEIIAYSIEHGLFRKIPTYRMIGFCQEEPEVAAKKLKEMGYAIAGSSKENVSYDSMREVEYKDPAMGVITRYSSGLIVKQLDLPNVVGLSGLESILGVLENINTYFFKAGQKPQQKSMVVPVCTPP